MNLTSEISMTVDPMFKFEIAVYSADFVKADLDQDEWNYIRQCSKEQKMSDIFRVLVLLADKLEINQNKNESKINLIQMKAISELVM